MVNTLKFVALVRDCTVRCLLVVEDRLMLLLPTWKDAEGEGSQGILLVAFQNLMLD